MMNTRLTPTEGSMTLSQLTGIVSRALSSAANLQNVWVVAETSDVRVAGGHCYLELIEKDEDTGKQLAKIRATVWASTYYKIAAKFLSQTGQRFDSDMKVMVCGSVSFHPVFGLAFNISDINTQYTLGDVMRRRMEILSRLQADGIIHDNQSLPWPAVPQRIAVISAANAAGYGDFINQLYSNPYRLRFRTALFPATMQGQTAAASVCAALDRIMDEMDRWDCVVIIRGGGATADLLCFDSYDLAAAVAQYPLPVVVGIGHERDVTVLDYVANMRVKTPTAAAEWLISRGESALAHLQEIASAMVMSVTERVGGCHRQLAYISGALPSAVTNVMAKSKSKLSQAYVALASVADRSIAPERMRLRSSEASLTHAISVCLDRERRRLSALDGLACALSPESTLARGYSITRVGGRAITSTDHLPPDTVIETQLAKGKIISVTRKIEG